MMKTVVPLIAALLLSLTEGFSPSLLSSTRFRTSNNLLSSTLSQQNDDDNESLQVNRRSAILTSMGALVAPLVLPMQQPAYAASVTKAKLPGDSIPTWTLDGGVRMPTLALNTVGLSADDAERALTLAVSQGMTHVDFHPGKERDGVAQYMAKNENSRQGLFLNTKIRKAPPGTSPQDASERTRAQIDEDLKALNVDSVDMLMLRDSPDAEVIQAQWAVLEDALAKGKTKSIGVINFCEFSIRSVLATAKVKPALNYYMLHVGMGRDAHGLRSFCESKGIRTFAYGAVGEPGPNEELLSNPVVNKIAQAHGKSPEEVCLRWVLQTGAAASVRPTTNFGLGTGVCVDPDCGTGLEKRANSYNWSLTTKEMKQLDSLTAPDDNPTLFSSAGCPNAFVMPK